jgi:hypothetical protein
MNTTELNRLLEKYYSGESTEAEENALRELFKGNIIPPGFNAEKDIFGYYVSEEKVPEPSPDFEARILAGIDASGSSSGFQKNRKFYLLMLGTAAGLLILAGSYFFFNSRTQSGDTFSDPEIAYAETMKILLDVSSQLNHGTEALEPVSKISELATKSFEAINIPTTIIEKNLKNFKYLQKKIEIANLQVDK